MRHLDIGESPPRQNEINYNCKMRVLKKSEEESAK
jgi:hypothetical protein